MVVSVQSCCSLFERPGTDRNLDTYAAIFDVAKNMPAPTERTPILDVPRKEPSPRFPFPGDRFPGKWPHVDGSTDG